MQGSTVFYPTLPSQPSVRKVYLKYLSTSLHQPVFEVSLRDSSQILLLDQAPFCHCSPSLSSQSLTRTSTGDMLMRDSNAVSRSLVVSFFIQRHPQAKSTTNERKDSLIEGRKSTKRWDCEELTEAIFQCNFTIVSPASGVRHTEKRSQWKDARII